MLHTDRAALEAALTPDRIKQTLLDLIDIRSPTGSEAEISHYVFERLKRNGVEARQQLVAENRPNVVATVRGQGDGLNLIFTGHMDTSYSGDEPHLIGEGFRPKGVFRDGWIWGLGANNMKSGLAGAITVVEIIAQSGIKLRGDLSLGCVVGEIEKAQVEEFHGPEYAGYGVGSKYMVTHGVTADYAILAEPTDLRICTANMGCLWARIDVAGTVAHSALTNRAGTVNAINVMRDLMVAIDSWADKFKADNVFMNEHANVTLACIKAGAPWRLSRNPSECSLYLDIRTLPGQTTDQVKRSLRSALRAFAEAHQIDEPALTFLVTDPPLNLDEKLPVVQAVAEAQQQVMGKSGGAFIRRPGSDAIHLTSYGVPCVQFGPGGRLHPDARGRSMHAVGDHVLLDDVVTAARVYLNAALDLCNRPAS